VTPNTQDRGRPRLSFRFAIQLLTLCFVLFAARGAWAQANAGIGGTVTDASGAVIPDASVTITNEGTSVTSKTTTSGAGTYAVTGLTPGQYTVTVEKTGFKKSVQNHVNVEVTVTSTRDFSLASGATTETVQVDAQQISLNTTQPQIGSTIEPTVGLTGNLQLYSNTASDAPQFGSNLGLPPPQLPIIGLNHMHNFYYRLDFDINGAGPCISHVTFVVSPCGTKVNSAVLWASKGFRKSSLMTTLFGGGASRISMRPEPTFRLPFH